MTTTISMSPDEYDELYAWKATAQIFEKLLNASEEKVELLEAELFRVKNTYLAKKEGS